MSTSKFAKKLVSLLLVLALILGLLALNSGQTFAVDFEDLFEAGDEGLSFTQYEGGLATLDDAGYDTALTESNDLREFIIRIVNFALGFLGLIAVIIVIYGGFLYVTAAGEQEKTETGKKAILYATIGLLIVLGSFAFVNTIIKGASGDGGEGSGQQYVVGPNQGGSFNAAAAQVKTLAREIYTGFLTFGESMEELRSVASDLNKSSLKYEDSLVAKEDVLSFLFNLKGKLTNMRIKVPKFSQTYVKLNELIRYVDGRIDFVQKINKTIYAKMDGDKFVICDPVNDIDNADEALNDARPTNDAEFNPTRNPKIEVLNGLSKKGYGVWQAMKNGEFDDALEYTAEEIGIISDKDYSELVCHLHFTKYPAGLFQEWTEKIVPNLISGDPAEDGQEVNSLIDLVQPLKLDYINKLLDIFPQLEEIQQSIVGIQAAETVLIGLYNDMMELYGYSSNSTAATDFPPDSFLDWIQNWEMDFNVGDANGDTSVTNFDQTGNILFAALEKHMEFQKELLKLRSVIARLRANVSSGNAPLIVTFDVLESIDPAGGNIVDDNITWIGITGVIGTDGQILDYNDSGIDCGNLLDLGLGDPAQEAEDERIFGSAFRQCTFNKPGTYTATVEIASNDPTKYVSGRSSLTIKVMPPNTQIKMDLKFDNKEIPVIDYYENGVLKVNKDYVPVTLTDAAGDAAGRGGITFDASQTENAQSFNWDFGDGTPAVEGATVTHPFAKEGQYKVTLEVINKLNQLDRKIFTLDVRNLAARIRVSPDDNIYINQAVGIDADMSSSDGGEIRGHEWKISKITENANGGMILTPVELGANQNKPSFKFEFKEPGLYQIDLKATNDLETSDADPVRIEVKSRAPVAKFEYEIKEKNQPSTVYLNAATSFDPDGPVENLQYEWKITPGSENGENWEVVNGGDIAANAAIIDRDPVIKFKKKTDYDVTLKVTDTTTVTSGSIPEFDEENKKITIDNVLDVDWGEDQESTAMLNEIGLAEMTFYIVSENAVAYEIDFGDGESESGDLEGEATVTHSYTESGKYEVNVTVYDEDDDDNSIRRRFFIGGGDKPLARAGVFVNDTEIFTFDEPITVGVKDVITFDAGESKNMDGTGRDLRYTWDFGDTENSSQERSTHKYKDLSPPAVGYYTVKLTVADRNDPSKFDTDEVKINVINKAPRFSAVQGLIAQNTRGTLVTPVELEMRVYGAEDEDGQIVQYKWWYFDIDDPEEKLGVQITRQPSAKLVIGTRGQEGQKLTYGFGLEVTDNSDLTYSNQDQIDEEQFSDITVTNGKNTMPTAKFNTNSTSIFVGDTVRFTSASADEDGEIEQYIWDVDGDGFFNDEPTDEASLEHVYTKKNTEGYEVKLKVVDDKGGEATSEPIKIFVDSTAKPPTAAFNYKVVEGSKGMKIQFTNTSTVPNEDDAQIIGYSWDFNASQNVEGSDSDGDGLDDNDQDSAEPNPSRLYTKPGVYKVKLTVTDDQGNTDDVINEMKIPLANPPTAAFKYKVIDGRVAFENNSKPDSKSDATLEKYIWDFDTESNFDSADSDGDGVTENDNDSELVNPVHSYEQSGNYTVKLTVIDNQGNSDEVTNEVTFSQAVSDLGGQSITGGSTSSTGSTGLSGGSNSTPSSGSNDSSNLRAVLVTNPVPAADGMLYLPGIIGSVRFAFTGSLGSVANYTIDKNILYDTDGNGILDDDKDFESNLAGSWTTNFEKAWGRIIVRLTVQDSQGNKDSEEIEIKFQ